MTPWQLVIVMGAEAERLISEHEGRAWAAWHTAALGRCKKMPSLKELSGKKEAPADMKVRLKAALKSAGR